MTWTAALVCIVIIIAIHQVYVLNRVAALETKLKDLKTVPRELGEFSKALRAHDARLAKLDGADPYRGKLPMLPSWQPGARSFCVDCRFFHEGEKAPICTARPGFNGYFKCAHVNEKHDCQLFQPKAQKPPPDAPQALPPPRSVND